MSHLHDTLAPPPDLDVLAARRAELVYRLAVGRGTPKCQARQVTCSPSPILPLMAEEASFPGRLLIFLMVAGGAPFCR